MITLAVAPLAAQAALALQGDGTHDSPYQVGTTQEWETLAAYMTESGDSLTGLYVKITADIDFDGSSITPLPAFNGTIDGDSHTIKGFSNTATDTHYGAVATEAESQAYIHDLTVEGEVATSYQYTGGCFGRLYGTLADFTSRVTVTSTASYTGGIAGYVGTGALLTGCANEGAVTSSWLYTAGIAGYSFNNVTYTECRNLGAITSTSSMSVTYTAGLLGMAHYCEMARCWNEGAVTTSGSGGGCAGLIAMASSTGTTTFTLTDCYNTGEITSLCYNAGLVLNSSYYSVFEMTGCYNTGNVTSTSTSSKSNTYTAGLVAHYSQRSHYTGCWNSGAVTTYGTYYTAGLLGYCLYNGETEEYRTYISNCYNTGEVKAANSYTAGLIAYMSNYLTVDSCHNTGDVSGTTNVGGITAYINGSSDTISCCYNAGDISATLNRAGGILGYTISQCVVASCFNVGDVSTSCQEKGVTTSSGFAIGGIAGWSGAAMTDVYSLGTITGASCVGGIVGYGSKGKTSITNAYFAGQLCADGDTCGNIVGQNLTANGKYWTADNSLTGTYFLTELSVVPDSLLRDTMSTGLTRAQLAAADLGDNWAAGDSCTYPRLAALATVDHALAHAAAVIPAQGDSYSSITQSFGVGAPDGVAWTASPDVVEFSGNTATFTATCQGELTLLATAGDVEVETQVTCDVEVEGVSPTTAGEAKTVVSEACYTPAGIQVAQPRRGIYIVRRAFSDGTTATAKEAR